MKKVLFSIIISLIICILVVLYFNHKPSLNRETIKKITMVTLPSPPTKKVITREKDIDKFIEVFNSLDLKATFPNRNKGWSLLIIFNKASNKDIIVLGNEVQVGMIWYKTDKDVFKEFRKLYEELDYIEEEYN